MKNFIHIAIFSAILLAFLGCENDSRVQIMGFEKMPVERTGISFKNNIIDLKKHNALTYETFYSGGGVALGDINNDGLLDIYFSGNQVADALYLNKGNWEFEDITLKAGIRNDGSWSTGVTMTDVNGDGWLDVYVCKSLYDEKPDLRKNKLYINLKDGTFIEQASAFGLDDIWRTQEACFFDYDNDGDLDVLMVNQPPNPGPLSPLKGVDYRMNQLGIRFLVNNGNTFTDRTEEVGLSHAGYALSASIADFNNDGWLDFYLAHDYNSPDKLFINRGGKEFMNTIDESCQQISFFSMGTDVSDFDNNGMMDFMVADMVAADPYRNKANMGGMNPSAFWKVVNEGGHYQYMYNSLQKNVLIDEKATPYFSNISQIAGVSKTDWSWSPLFADFNNDGLEDIYITNGIKRDLRFTDGLAIIKNRIRHLLSNENITQKNLLDSIDAVKQLKSLPSSKLNNYFFINKNGTKFQDYTENWNLDIPSFSNGSAVGDLDNDGDLDLVVSNIDDYPFVFKNELSSQYFLRVNPKLNRVQNTNLIGVNVYVYTNGKSLLRNSKTNKGFYSSSETTIHFGLGNHQNIDSVLIFWDSEYYSKFTDLELNKTHNIYKSESKLLSRSKSEKFKTVNLENKASHFDLNVSHKDDGYNDYKRQVLLPYEIGDNPLPIKVVDLNGDKKEDFIVGNEDGKKPLIFFQNENGKFDKQELHIKRQHAECTDIIANDFDGDNDLDLYFSIGGTGYDNGDKKFKNYFLINNYPKGFSYLEDNFITNPMSTKSVASLDINNDGKSDLVVSSKSIPGKYPQPTPLNVLVNKSDDDKIHFENASVSDDNLLKEVGLVNEIKIADLDKDGDDDMVVIGEWMPITLFYNNNGRFEKTIVPHSVGWWMTCTLLDADNDGYLDLLIGNLGDNAKYKSDTKNKFATYYDDFDNNGQNDIVLTYEKDDKEFPVRGRSCSSEQIPDIGNKIPSYHEFASLDITGIYGEEKLANSQKFEINEFSSVLVLNKKGKDFELKPLPINCQLSAVKTIQLINDNTYLLAGNQKNMEIETPMIDASYGQIITVNEKNSVEIIKEAIDPLFSGQIHSIDEISIDNTPYLIFLPLHGDLILVKKEAILN